MYICNPRNKPVYSQW